MNSVDNVKNGVYTYNDKDFTFSYFTDIGVIKKNAFVKNVVNLVVDENHYNSMLRDAMFDFQIVQIFTDVFDDSEIADRGYLLNEVVDFIENTKIADIVKSNVEDGLIDELSKAVDKDIEYKTGIHVNPLTDNLVNLIKLVENMFSEINVEDLMGFAQIMNGISGELTMEKMIDAYGKSDVFKQIREDADKRNKENMKKVIAATNNYVNENVDKNE